MKKTQTKLPKTSRSLDLFGANGLETTLPVLSGEELTTIVGGGGSGGPKLPKYSCD